MLHFFQRGQRPAHARMRRIAGMHGDEALGGGDRVIPFGRVGKDRRGVAVFAHAENRDVRRDAKARVGIQRGNMRVQILSGVGERINETSRRVASAARDSARETIDSYGLNADNALEKVSILLDSATQAASTIGTAARGALKDR